MPRSSPGRVSSTDTTHPGTTITPSRTARIRRATPGLVISFLVGLVALGVSQLLPVASPALVAIVVGVVLANTVLPASWAPGIALASKPVLRISIVLLGLQLALGDILGLGPGVIVVIVAVVAGGIGAGVLCGALLRIDRAQTLLVACGFSICGAAAVAAASDALAPRPRPGDSAERTAERRELFETQTATAVALVVVFGSLMIPVMPLVTGLLTSSESVAGIWTGGAVHEVGQVVAAGSLEGPEQLRTAVLVKLGRVVLLAPVIAILVAVGRRGSTPSPDASRGAEHSTQQGSDEDTGAVAASTSRPPLIPLFVVGFLVAVVLRSTGWIPMPVLDAVKPVQTLTLAAAMFGLGTGVRLSLLRTVGGRPVILAVLITVVVFLIAGIGAHLAG
jgi:uncharacterized integral membrane protein (TIGR00698 family)